MNDLVLCIEVVTRSRQPLGHIRHGYLGNQGSRLGCLVPKDHQYEMAYGYQTVT